MSMPSEEVAVSPEPSGPFDIYESAEGPRHVDSPVRRRILAMMRGRERTVSEMIALTGLGKSTLSAHLAQMGREGLLDYREDPEDRRCKRYYLTSRLVGTAGPRKERPLVAEDMDHPLGKNGALPRLLLRSLIAELDACGLDLEPVVRETGKRVGELLGRDEPAHDLKDWAAAAARVWKQNHLGELVLVSVDPLRLQVDACRLCCRSDGRLVRLCQVSAGLLEGMACESLGSLVEVEILHDDEQEGQRPGTSRNAAGNGQASGDGAQGCHCLFQVKVTAGPEWA